MKHTYAAAGTFTATLIVTDDLGARGSDSLTITVTAVSQANADLSVFMTVTPTPASMGQSLTYTLTISNAGPNDSAEVTLSDKIPSSLNVVSANPGQGSCKIDAAVTCTFGSLTANGKITVTVIATPTSLGTLSNTATVASSTLDPNLSDNTASVIAIVSAAGPSSGSGGGGGGGCSMTTDGERDDSVLVLLTSSVVILFWKRR